MTFIFIFIHVLLYFILLIIYIAIPRTFKTSIINFNFYTSIKVWRLHKRNPCVWHETGVSTCKIQSILYEPNLHLPWDRRMRCLHPIIHSIHPAQSMFSLSPIVSCYRIRSRNASAGFVSQMVRVFLTHYRLSKISEAQWALILSSRLQI
jgi:hypothetical protein